MFKDLEFFFFTCLLLPSFSGFAYGFSSILEPCWDPLPRSFGSCIPFWLCALTRHPAPHGKLISLKSWHFLTFLVGTSQQQELSPPPHLRPKHNGLQKRGWVTWRDRALHAGILDVFSRLTWVTLLWNTVLMWTVQLPAARSSCHHRDRSNRLISAFFKEPHGFELGGVRKYQLLRDGWIFIVEFLLFGKKDRSYRCCSLLLSIKGILYVQYFYISAFPPIRIWIRIDNILYLGKKMDCYFYSSWPLCVYFVPNYSHCYILVFSFSLLLFINVYIIYFYYQGFYFNSYYPVC